MAATGRWGHGTGERAELGYEPAECPWGIFSLADRFDVDMACAFSAFVEAREHRLRPAVQPVADED